MATKGAIRHSFDKKSLSYAKNCSLQNEVATILLDFCESWHYKKIIDLGAGSGNVALNLAQILDKNGICANNFIALDSSPNMLALHPRKLSHIAQIRLIVSDFESYDFSDDFDLILSSSSLQWAKNLDLLFKRLKDLFESSHKKFAFAIFTSESLCELHAFLGTDSPLKSSSEILAIAQKYFCIESKIQHFKREFSTRDELLAYLKNSALLGGGNLAFRDKKRLKCAFPHTALNFEVLFIKN